MGDPHHPAVEWVAHYLSPRPDFRVAVPPTPRVGLEQELLFTAHQAAASLMPQYGYYVWRVWYDQHGRFITDAEATWRDHPDAIRLPPWNPPRSTFPQAAPQ